MAFAQKSFFYMRQPNKHFQAQLTMNTMQKQIQRFTSTRILRIALTIALCSILAMPSTTHADGTIVILNGTSSAGKTSITKELQKIYGNTYAFVHGDYVETYAYIEDPLIKAGPMDIRNQLSFDALLHYVKTASQNGTNLIVDIVQSDDKYERDFSALKCDKLIKVLVYCPLDVIVNHVAKRNKSGIEAEKRNIFQSVSQFNDIYKLEEFEYETVVDRIQTNSIKQVLCLSQQEIEFCIQTEWQLTEKEAIEERQKAKLFALEFIEQFQLDRLEEIVLVPKKPWDLILNKALYSSEECAEIIKRYLD
ncbi:MAG: hypothetical protein NT124_04065 [Candidatus Dependentiae bacterium]|nr:hypothetical protein [Candidatus Dependentiae bacterium]